MKKNMYVEVVFGGFQYRGDIRLMEDTVGIISNVVMPVLSEGNKQAAEMGLIPVVARDNGEGYD